MIRFQVVSRWKAVYNETPVEFLPGEGKPRRGIAMKMNEMFSVTPSGVETEKELKHSFQVVSRWKAVYNETPVEFLPGEGKPRRGIAMKMNEMFSVTPSGVETEKELKHSFQVVSRWKAVYNETPVEFISEEGKTRRCIRLNINQMFSITPGNILWFLCTKLNVKRTSFIVALLPIYS
ncbi:hypothetical protein T08_7035 [Trichinella sp. T8]|nr:hypothetical protein T08_7035 [Trichinella sp. T8]